MQKRRNLLTPRINLMIEKFEFIYINLEILYKPIEARSFLVRKIILVLVI